MKTLASEMLRPFHNNARVLISLRGAPKDAIRSLMCELQTYSRWNWTKILRSPDAVLLVQVAHYRPFHGFVLSWDLCLSDYIRDPDHRELPVVKLVDFYGVQEDDAPLQCPGIFSALLGGDTT